MKTETRSYRGKIETSNDKLVGYAAVFNAPSRVLSERGKRFVEVIAPGTFARSLKAGADITAHWSHNEDARPPLGRTSSGKLKLSEDATGLRFELDLPKSAADVREAVERGDVWGMSFMFANETDTWKQDNGQLVRTLHDLELHHVAIVTEPAYPDAYVEARSYVEPPGDMDLVRKKLKSRAYLV